MNLHLQRVLNFIQQKESSDNEDRQVILKAIEDVDKELEIAIFKLDQAEKVKQTTAILLEETIGELEQKRKAVEAQNRELEIETSLERVRTVAMSMSKPDEMLDVCHIISDQLQLLHVADIRNVQTAIINTDKGTYINYQYFTPYQQGTIEEVEYHKHPKVMELVHQMQQSADAFFSVAFEGEELDLWRQYRKDDNQFPDPLSDEAKSVFFYFYSIGQGGLGISTYTPLAEEGISIFKRFRNVFNLAYRRFLDIQHAEAQAREAQIEAALERVRSKTMAMHKSDELASVVNVMFNEFRNLQSAEELATLSRGFINNIYEELNQFDLWVTDLDGSEINQQFFIDIQEPTTGQPMYEAWINKKPVFILDRENEKLHGWLHYLESIHFNVPPEMWNSRRVSTFIYYPKGFIGITSFSPLSESNKQILTRFAKVFEQTYTRFLDLEKAEAQTRESQIQLALERVRARTMAMQKSDELPETSHLLFEQMKELGEPAEQLTIGIVREEDKVIEISATLHGDTLKNIYRHSIEEPYLMNKIYKAWKMHQKTLIVELRGEELNAYNQYRNELTHTEMFPTTLSEENRRIVYAAFFSKGMLALGTNEPRPPQSLQLLERFASVFDLTYTRFLDLEKAEAQAREALIETALERVRSKAMAMQKPNELTEVAQLLRNEMGKLGVEELEGSTVFIHQENTDKAECWFAIKDKRQTERQMISDYIPLNLNDTWVGKEMLHFFNTDEKQISIPMKGAHRSEWIEYCYTFSPQLAGFYGDHIPDRTYHLYKFSNGAIGAAAEGDISPESWDLLQRATTVFSLAYTRFNDLQIAAANAREAQIEASLERVRTSAMAMQKSEDLAKSIAIVFEEFEKLNLGMLRCGIGILNAETRTGDIWSTVKTGEGLKAQVSGNESLDIHPMLKSAFDAWLNQEDLSYELKDDDLIDYYHALAQTDFKLPSSQHERSETERLIQYYHVATLKAGGLFAFRESPFTDEAKQVMKRFADVFNLTYTRFLDLQKAEEQAHIAEEQALNLQKEKIRLEHTLNELRTTQSQLIQSEKMASLGELTAGIAHEIQNPLNFVNNFSEVNSELIDELKEELATGNLQQANEIADSIKENEEKIVFHGKRADAIVKGMLQHSRTSSGVKEPTDINALVDEYLRLAYHGLRAKDKSFNATMKTDYDPGIGMINIIPQDIGRVVLNLITNAFYAVTEKSKSGAEEYVPTVTVSTREVNHLIEITVRDNGNGISPHILDKIFQPFFTTKPTGEGTGLGLSLSYDIIKAHGGDITVETKIDQGTTFIISLPQ